jgi:hypothetical protein
VAHIVGKDTEVQAKNAQSTLFLWSLVKFGEEMPIITP